MTRVDLADWCDLVRGVIAPAREQQLQKLLEVGDPESQRTFKIWQQVAVLARQDQMLEIPPQAEWGAKAIAALRRPAEARPAEARPAKARPAKSSTEGLFEHLGSWWRRLPVTTVFDSLLEPAPAGTRDLHSPYRQLLFESPEYTVDVRWEHETDQQHGVLIGQVLRRSSPPQAATQLPIYVLGDEILARAQTNRFGEFLADNLPKRPLRLCVIVGERDCLELPLDPAPQREVG